MPAILFWTGFGWAVADAATMTERHGGPYSTLHKAWKAADADGFAVVDVLATRGLVKQATIKQLPLPVPAEPT